MDAIQDTTSTLQLLSQLSQHSLSARCRICWDYLSTLQSRTRLHLMNFVLEGGSHWDRDDSKPQSIRRCILICRQGHGIVGISVA